MSRQDEKLKLMFPKIFQWFYKDFGSSHKSVLDFLLPYFPKKLQQDLLDFPDPIIRFTDFNWKFCYSISPLEETQTLGRCEDATINKVDYRKLTFFPSHSRIIVKDTLIESPFSFSIPLQLLQQLLQIRHRTAENSSPAHQDSWKSHLELLTNATEVYELMVGDLLHNNELSFHPAPLRADPILSCSPINLHTHRTISSEESWKQCEYYFQSTLGVPAAHVYGCADLHSKFISN